MDPIEPGWLGLGSLRPHPAFPVPNPPLEDVGVEDETIEVTEVMMEVMLVDDMSDMGDVVCKFGWVEVSVRVMAKVIEVDGREGVFAHYTFSL